MGDKQHGSVKLLAQAASGLAQLASCQFIYTGEGLIHQHQVGLDRQRPSQTHPLALTPG